MATSSYLSNPVVKINAIDVTDQCSAATLIRAVEKLPLDAYGNVSRKFTGGVQNNEFTVTMYMSYAASESYATLKVLVGTTFNLTVQPTSAANSATNPLFTLAGCYLEELPVVVGEFGSLSVMDLVFSGGDYTETVV